MLTLIYLLTENSIGQVMYVPASIDSAQNKDTSFVSVDLKRYMSEFEVPNLRLPFDLNSKHPENLPTKDSLLQWQQYITTVNGRVNMGYDLGQLPNYVAPNVVRPMQVFHTEASLNATVLFLPVKLSWRYATIKNPIGVNNYFRLSMDTDRFKELSILNQAEVSGQIDKQLDILSKKQGELNGKLGYTELLLNQMKLQLQKTLQEQQSKLKEMAEVKAKAEYVKMDSLIRDSINRVEPTKRDSLMNAYNEKHDQALEEKNKLDSLDAQFQLREKQIEQLQQKFDTIQFYVTKLSSLKNQLDSIETNALDQKEKWMTIAKSVSAKQLQSLGLFKKLDVGLTYPKTSALSKNAIPVKGIDMEIQKGHWLYALTAGVTMNNLMVTNNTLQNSLQNSSNLFNQFDFQAIKDKRFIVMTKTGYGDKEKNHAYVGLRYTNNAVTTGFYQVDSSSNVNPAVGIELDLRWVPRMTKGTAVDLIYGKTSLAQLSTDTMTISPIKSLFSADRTHTGLFRINQQVNRLHSTFTASLRFLDANADMASMGVLQPNNLRLELQSKHKITSGTQIGFTYRTDQNNVNRMLDTTKQVNMYGCNASTVLLQKIQLSGQVNYLNQQYIQPNMLSQAMNYMAVFSANGNYTLFGLKQNTGIQADLYKITTNQGLTNLTHFGADQQTMFESGKNTFTLAYFKSQLPTDIGNSKTWLVQDAIQYKFKRLDLTAGLKLAKSTKYGSQMGGFAGLNFLWTKQLSFMCRVEKLILGDFYNSYDPIRFAQFPFYIQTSINYQFK
jgi:hypothetical protein